MKFLFNLYLTLRCVKIKQNCVMSIPPLQNSSSSGDEFNSEWVLADWMKAIADFHHNHNELVMIINNQKEKSSQVSKEVSLYIGQCPTESLLTLVLVMQRELENLLCDMNQLKWLSQLTSRQHYKKLVDHTRTLNLLNDKAKIRLLLIADSTS